MPNNIMIRNKEFMKNSGENVFFNLKKIISAMPEFIYWKDANGYYKGCNDFLLKVSGFNSIEDIIDKNDYDFGQKLGWSKEIIEKIIRTDKEILSTGVSKFNIEELPLKMADGSIAWLKTSKVPIKDESDNIVGIIGVSVDYTKQKQAELKLLEETKKRELAYKRESEFLSIVAHEVRGPIGNSILVIELIKKYLHSLPEQEEKYIPLLKELLIQSKDLLNSIDFMLKILSLNKNGIEHRKIYCDVKNFLENLIAVHEKENTKKIIFKLEIVQSLPECIVFDSYHTYEILDILIKNAVKYSDEDGIIIIKTDLTENNLIFSIQDHGAGISEQHLKKLLQPFISSFEIEREVSYQTPSIKLCYIKTILNFIGGDLMVNSTVGSGSEFSVLVPYSQDKKPKNNLNKSDVHIEKLTVLLVEDNHLTMELQKNELSLFINNIDTAESGSKAVALCLKKNYDIIFMDIVLQDMNGIETMGEIIKNIKNNNKIPYFIGVTSRATEEDIDFFITKGFTTVLIKPVSKLDFYNCIKTIIKMNEKSS